MKKLADGRQLITLSAMNKFIVLMMLSFVLPVSLGYAQQPTHTNLLHIKSILESQQQIMEWIVQSKSKSRCLNLKNCKVDTTTNENIQSYFLDDVDLALEGLPL